MNMMRNLVTSLILYEKVETTISKGKEIKPFLDHLICRSKAADLNAHRYLSSVLFDKKAAKKVIEELVPRYKDRNSGFASIVKIKNRIGDNATIVRVELMDKKVFVEAEKKTAEKPTVKTEKAETKQSAKAKGDK